MPLTTDNIYGVVSLIFWSVMIIVTLTYVTLVMRADNDGEGGIMALIALVRRWGAQAAGDRLVLATLGIFGAALVLRRQHDHPGDLGAVRGRGLEGRRSRLQDLDRADHRRYHRCAVRGATARNGVVGRRFSGR